MSLPAEHYSFSGQLAVSISKFTLSPDLEKRKREDIAGTRASGRFVCAMKSVKHRNSFASTAAGDGRRALRKHLYKLGLIAAIVCAAASTPLSPLAAETRAPELAAPIVKTRAGAVRGKVKEGVREFLGIPYAAPPVGELRWQPPALHASWPGELDATRTRSWCPQLANFPDSRVAGSEDCLYLNIYTPDPAGSGLPVMVWIHGGTFIVGSGAPFNGSNLARKGNLVVVTINYRLGALGFLAHRSLDATDSRHVSGNYGLMDQQAALRWVKDNIAAFSGDPHKVTIAGQSAGAISAGLQMVSPGAAGLFQRAILESGPFPHVQTLTEAEVRGDELAAKLDCDKASDAAACMRAKTITQIVSAIPADPLTSGNLIWSPIVDGHALPSQPAEAIAAGHVNRVSVINGSNRDEGTLMRAAAKPISAERFVQSVRSLLGKDAARVLTAYPLANYSSPTLAAAAAYGDATFSCRIIKTGAMLSALEPVYQYEFNDTHAPLTFLRNPPFPLGAFHSSEIQYVFGDIATNSAASPAQKKLSDAIMSYWIGFITSGDPGGSPRWGRYRADHPWILSLAPGAIEDESGFAKIHHCDLWDSIQF